MLEIVTRRKFYTTQDKIHALSKTKSALNELKSHTILKNIFKALLNLVILKNEINMSFLFSRNERTPS